MISLVAASERETAQTSVSVKPSEALHRRGVVRDLIGASSVA